MRRGATTQAEAGVGGSGRSPGPAGPRIRQTVADVRRHVFRGLAVAVAAWCGSALLGLMALAPWLSGSSGWSPGSPVPLLVVAAALAVAATGFAAWRRMGRWWGADHRITRAMDAVAGLDEGATLGSLELYRSAPDGTSPGLRELALNLVGDRLHGGPKALSGKLGRGAETMAKRAGASLALAAPLVALVAALAPARAFSAWDGLLHPFAVLAEPVLPSLSLAPGTVEVRRGAVVEVVARAPLRDSVVLRWDATGQVAGARTVLLDDGEGRSVLPPVAAETRYWVEAPDGAQSPVHVLTPVDPLFVGTFALEVAYPPHTGLADEEHRNEASPLVLPAGTLLRIRGEGSRPIGSGALVDEEGRPALAFAVDGPRFQGSWTPARSGVYSWEFSDAAGDRAATAPEPLVLEVSPDRPPQIEIAYPGPDTVLPVDMRQPLVVRVRDDYGVERVEIVARRVAAFGEAGEPVVRGVALGGVEGAIVRPVLDVSEWKLSPGDVVRYRARSVDNHPSRQTAETREHVLRAPEVSEVERAAQEELDRAAEEVRSLAEEAERAEQEARELRSRSEAEGKGGRSGEENGFEAREEVAQALERQQRMTSAVDSLQRELAELREALRDAGTADPELRDRIEGLEELLEDAASDEQRDALAQQIERLAEMDPEALQEALEQMVAAQEELRRRLEASVEQFRQAALDQDFRATSREAEELAEEQELLAEAMGEGGDDELRAEQQAALEGRAGELQEQLEALQRRLAEAGEQDAGAGVQEARRQLSQARRQMAQAGRMASQGQSRSASEEAGEAAGEMAQVSQELNEAMMQMQQQMMQALQDALGRTALDALSLARRQSELRGEMVGATASELAALRGDEAAVAQGVRNLAENYAAETEMAAPGARDLMTALGEAMEQLDRTVEAMERRRSRGPPPTASAEAVVRALNEVARLAMTSGRQGESQGAATASEQMMQQLQQLAQQQGEIMQDAASLSPMRLGEETMSRQVEEMSARQEDVARELGEISESEGGEEEGEADPLGDLSAMAEEAERLAEALAGGRLDPEVLRRQERLFHRLLDAGRTLERDEESEERESEAPGDFSREDAGPLTEDDLDVLRFRLPSGAALRRLPPAQRALVISYFERLNRNGEPEAEAGSTRPAGDR